MNTKYMPLIIIGAPRSGTNILRDVLTLLPGLSTWPCDEINYIWRHGNIRYPSDEFTPEMARPEVIKYIRKSFEWVASKYKSQIVVEKTCANSLRLSFVERVVPEARYIFIRRNGLDVIGSAKKRWKADLDIPYLARKARFVPILDLPYYAGRYVANRLHRLLSTDKRLALWGPKLDGMEKILNKYSLDEICALQWKRCLDKAAEDLNKIPKDRWIEIGYEDFVTHPEKQLQKLLGSLNIDYDDQCLQAAISKVSPGYIGRGRSTLSEEEITRVMPFIKDSLR